MNSLNRDLIKGEEVIVRADVLKPEYVAQMCRVFIVESGFGMSHTTRGTAVWGKYKFDGEECRIEGYEIDAEETALYREAVENDKSNKG